MEAIEIARRMAELGNAERACQAYSLAIHENNGANPAQDMEAAVYILRSGGDYKIAYTCFVALYNRGYLREECLEIMTQAFYLPNVKQLRGRYERNRKLLGRYPYLFRRDFPEFEDLPVKFYPFDEKSFLPFYPGEERFGEAFTPGRQVVSRNFFKDLEKPVLASEVYSQYELEYLTDNVRKSEHIGRENHLYLHYRDWEVFCSYLQCLNMRPVLSAEKPVFLIGDEIEQYPIDFKKRFGIDYSQYQLKPPAIREYKRLIWHTQLASHNGGDFFNEIFDGHPNLLATPSVMLESVEQTIETVRKLLDRATNARSAAAALPGWKGGMAEELYLLRDRTDKDIFVAIIINDKGGTDDLDFASRIVPAVFFQPHFSNLLFDITADDATERSTLFSKQYEKLRGSPIYRGFKYIKTFTPIRRPTTSHGATVKFMFNKANEEGAFEKKAAVGDAISQRVLNRSFMIDPNDRLYMDSVLVRFEDGKLNPKATFTALAAFLDLPYTESMTYCSLKGELNPESLKGNDLGFSTAAIYRTYDEYVNNNERYFLEFFLRDVYRYCGYDFQTYDGEPMDGEKLKKLMDGFDMLDSYIEKSWRKNVMPHEAERLKKEGASEEQIHIAGEIAVKAQLKLTRENRLRNALFLLRSPYFINKDGQPLHMMPKLELDPALLEQPLYH